MAEDTGLALLLHNSISYVWRFTGAYIIWISLHYLCSWMYAYICTSWGLTGFFMAPFIVTSPHCSALRWCIFHGAETITAMWVVFGTWIITLLIGR